MNIIAEEMLNRLIQKIKKKDSEIREFHHQENAAQDLKESAHRLKEKLDKKEAECDQAEEEFEELQENA